MSLLRSTFTAGQPTFLNFQGHYRCRFMYVKSNHYPSPTAVLNSISCIDQTQTALLPVQTWCLLLLLHQAYSVLQRSAAMPNSCLVDLGDQHISEASRWSCSGPSEVCADVQRERLARLLVTGGNPKHLRWYNLWDKMVCLLCATGTHNTIRKGAWRVKLCWHKRTELWMHWTGKAYFWVGCLFSNRKKSFKKKTCKITDWFKPNFEAIIQLIQNVGLSTPCKSDVWNSPAANSCISLQLFLLIERQTGWLSE